MLRRGESLTLAYRLSVARAFDKATMDVAKAPNGIFDQSGDRKSAITTLTAAWQAFLCNPILARMLEVCRILGLGSAIVTSP